MRDKKSCDDVCLYRYGWSLCLPLGHRTPQVREFMVDLLLVSPQGIESISKRQIMAVLFSQEFLLFCQVGEALRRFLSTSVESQMSSA